MDLAEALEVLHLRPGTPMQEVREAYRAQVRLAHPDVVGPDGDEDDATARTARITGAFAVVRRAVLEAGTDAVPEPPPPPPPPRAAGSPAVGGRLRWRPTPTATRSPSARRPPRPSPCCSRPAARLGGIGYVDRQLGILEVIVRFEGGPSCSVLITLQGRAFGTDAFCTMDSIEAAPTPPLRPVVEALVEELRRRP